ncbi:MAG: hypothetical protein CSA72_11660 [Rhodobacterales bacterium]|nr:MAG: hypothetical protein CSA72_11660 [Rhodobacterales bacterium]
MAKTTRKTATKKGASEVSYDEVIDIQGAKIPFVPSIITPRIEKTMRNASYEAGECKAVRAHMRPGDRVLELGAGVGLVSTVAAGIEGVGKIVSIEANPDLLPVIAETHRLNGITTVETRNAIAGAQSAESAKFYLRADFWASSMEPDSRPYVKDVDLPVFAVRDLIEETDPTVIIANIEGAEEIVFQGADLGRIRTIIIKLHPSLYGDDGARKILSGFAEQGFKAEKEFLDGAVRVLTRAPKEAVALPYMTGLSSPEHAPDPRFVITTCMKNEGPFILEWIAYHKAIGVQDFVIFTNDCTDGSDAILDRLDEMGVVQHLTNPAFLFDSTFFQPIAMKYAMTLPKVRSADYVIETDVDEFINIHVGDGTLPALLDAAGPFHVLSISEVNFSSSGHYTFEDVWLTEAFTEHETKEPGHWQARRGVKSIFQGLDNFAIYPVHRPGAHPGLEKDYVWLNGSGKPVPEEFITKHENGMDRRGCYDLVQLDHHPLRSVESYLLKRDRGDVVNEKNLVDHHYYRRRSLGGNHEHTIASKLARARDVWRDLMADEELARLHKASVKAHKDKIVNLLSNPDLAELDAWIKETYFKDS